MKEVSPLFPQAHHIHISLPSQASESELRDACILLLALKKQGKHVTVEDTDITKTILPSHILLPTPHVPANTQEKDVGKMFLVSLKGLAPWISKIHYEKTEDDLKLYFTLRDSEASDRLRDGRPAIEVLPLSSPPSISQDQKVMIAQTSELPQILASLSLQDQVSCSIAGHALSTMKRVHSLATGIVPREIFRLYGAQPATLQEAAGMIREVLSKAPFCIFFAKPESSITQFLAWSIPEATSLTMPLTQKETRGGWTLGRLPGITEQEAYNSFLKQSP
ncbi:MAG: hypothetical protein Q8P71_01725 [bacterium]|nr:hypothetical protein [bacterium]